MDDVEVTLMRHIAGHWDPVLGQLCTRCGMVLDEGLDGKCYEVGMEPPHGFPPGEAVMVSTDSGARFRVVESHLLADRDRSDEADCLSIIEDTHG